MSKTPHNKEDTFKEKLGEILENYDSNTKLVFLEQTRDQILNLFKELVVAVRDDNLAFLYDEQGYGCSIAIQEILNKINEGDRHGLS